jgi:hypothetical protein
MSKEGTDIMGPRVSIAFAVVPVLALFLSCGDEGVVGTGQTEYSRKTPEDVVQAVAYAMEYKDIDIYTECLADEYTFEFLPEDCKGAGVFEHTPWWGKTQDVTAMDSMFSDTSVSSIGAEFVIERAFIGVNTLRVNISVTVTIEHEGWGEPTIYWAYKSWLDFTFVEDQFDHDLWQISAVEEVLKNPPVTAAPSGANECTFGRLKAMFRRRQECELSPRSTPECLISSFEWALQYKDIDDYSQCLSDTYLFEFTPVDAEGIGLPPDAPWWGKTQDMAAMAGMFEHPDVARIECTLSIESGPSVSAEDVTYRLEPDMRFTIDPGGGGEPVTYWVRNSWLDVEIVPDPYDSGKWVFERMTEVLKAEFTTGSGTGPTESGEYSTFGGVKAMFK